MSEHSAKNIFGKPFIELATIDSTNNYALQQIHAGLAQPGTAIFAHNQVAGKGQHGKQWKTEKSANITVSQIINPSPLLISRQFELSAAVSVGIARFFRHYAGDDTRIKWPNDLYWQDRKAGGVLIENIISSGSQPAWKWAVAGIGININQVQFSPDISRRPVSLRQITGKQFDLISLTKELLQYIETSFYELLQYGFDKTLNEYNDYLFKRGEPVLFTQNSTNFVATIERIDSNGLLLLKEHPYKLQYGDAVWNT